MDLLTAITNLTGPEMVHGIAERAGAFWLAWVVTTGLIAAVWTAERRRPRIWK